MRKEREDTEIVPSFEEWWALFPLFWEHQTCIVIIPELFFYSLGEKAKMENLFYYHNVVSNHHYLLFLRIFYRNECFGIL